MTVDQPPLFDRLDVLDDLLARDAKLNMAVDEVLLERKSEVPLLRLYRWARPAVSFGYFTPWAPVATSYPAREWVRRWTGGGIVEHGDDLTYSLLIPRSHPMTNQRAGESYRLIHLALQAALWSQGWGRMILAGDVTPGTEVAFKPCFASPVRHDLLAAGQKVSGAAQRRTRHGLLHQGSILGPDGSLPDARRLVQALPAAFAPNCEPRPLQIAEEMAARQLAKEKYADERWLCRI